MDVVPLYNEHSDFEDNHMTMKETRKERNVICNVCVSECTGLLFPLTRAERVYALHHPLLTKSGERFSE